MINVLFGLTTSLFISLASFARAYPNLAPLRPYDVGASHEVAREARAGRRQFKIAIIDLGYKPDKASPNVKICKTGHYDYQTNTPNLAYTGSHGTRIMNLIADKLKDVDYCFVVYQVSRDSTSEYFVVDDYIDAMKRARSEHVDAINLSVDSLARLPNPDEEKVFKYVAETSAIFLSAGNSSIDLDKTCKVYPACYPKNRNIILVGSRSEDDPTKHETYSNYGKRIDAWASGEYTEDDVVYSGTSYAAPRALAEYILWLDARQRR